MQKLKIQEYKNFGGINTYDSQYQTGSGEFLDLRNWMFERPGALISRPGTEYHLTLNSQTFLVKPYNTFQYVQRTGASYLVFDSGSTLYMHAGSASAAFGPITSSATLPLLANAENYDNSLFYANGEEFGYLKNTGFVRFNLALTDDGVIGPSSGVTFDTSLPGITAVIASGTWVASFTYARGYDDIYRGPFYLANAAQNKFGQQRLSPNTVLTFANTLVSTGKWVYWGFTVPSNYGISGLVPIINRRADGATVYRYASAAPLYLTTITGTTLYHVQFDHPETSVDMDLTRNSQTIIPKHLAVFNNHMMVAGQTTQPNTVYFSEPGQPDNIQPDNFFEVISGDGDIIQALAVFQDALIIFKRHSIYELTGSGAENFQLRDLTKEYGLVSPRGWVVWENNLWFIDYSGIIQYDGANFVHVSKKVRSTLDSIDKTKISAVHVKKKRQVWFSSTNIIFVYDYEVGGWTFYDQVAIDKNAGPANIQYGATRTDVSYWKTGASFHELIRFGDSLITDLGQGITLVSQTKYHKRLEHTTQELWRRLYLNHDVPGATQGVTIQLLADYGTSIQATRSAYLDAFQKRVEFGISSRSLSIKMILQASQTIRFNGYVLETRFLRKI